MNLLIFTKQQMVESHGILLKSLRLIYYFNSNSLNLSLGWATMGAFVATDEFVGKHQLMVESDWYTVYQLFYASKNCFFSDSLNGWICLVRVQWEFLTIFRTTNSGVNWITEFPEPDIINSILFY